MKIHQILITEDKQLPQSLPKLTEFCLNNVKNVFHDYEHHLYSGEEIEEIIKNNFDKDVFTAYNKLNAFAFRADLARACLLHLYGGLYIDLHIQFFFRFDKTSLYDLDFLGLTEHYSHFGLAINNSILFSKSKSLVMKNYIERIILNCKEEYYGPSFYSPTGPYCLGKAFHSVVNNNEYENKCILAGESYYYNDCEMGFVLHSSFLKNENDNIIMAMRRKRNLITRLGYTGVNNYIPMYLNKEIYNQNIKF